MHSSRPRGGRRPRRRISIRLFGDHLGPGSFRFPARRDDPRRRWAEGHVGKRRSWDVDAVADSPGRDTVTLVGLTLSGAHVRARNGKPGTGGADGRSGADAPAGAPGRPGRPGEDGAGGGKGTNGYPAQGGAIEIARGATVLIERCSFRDDVATGGNGGPGGQGGTGGNGGAGAAGSPGSPSSSGGPGGPGGHAGAAGDGGDGGVAGRGKEAPFTTPAI